MKYFFRPSILRFPGFSIFFIMMFFSLGLWVPSARSQESMTAGPVVVTAVIPSNLTLDMRIVDQVTTAQVYTMDFNNLAKTGDEFRALTYFKVYLTVSSAGVSCNLYQTGTPLARVGGSELIPAGAYIANPAYAQSDNNGLSQPNGSAVSARDTAVGDHLLYSDPTGSTRVITVQYTLSGDPNTGATEIIPSGQKTGTYTGTVLFTLTAG